VTGIFVGPGVLVGVLVAVSANIVARILRRLLRFFRRNSRDGGLCALRFVGSQSKAMPISMNAYMHAARNERARTVINARLLFFFSTVTISRVTVRPRAG
jgi:hypothetical protein